jgi:hypothetical protein
LVNTRSGLITLQSLSLIILTISILTSFEQQNSLASRPQTVAVQDIPFGKSL